MLKPEDMLTEEEAARTLRRSRQWLRDRRLRGLGPDFVLMGKSPLYDPADLARWLESMKQTPTNDEV